MIHEMADSGLRTICIAYKDYVRESARKANDTTEVCVREETKYMCKYNIAKAIQYEEKEKRSIKESLLLTGLSRIEC